MSRAHRHASAPPVAPPPFNASVSLFSSSFPRSFLQYTNLPLDKLTISVEAYNNDGYPGVPSSSYYFVPR